MITDRLYSNSTHAPIYWLQHTAGTLAIYLTVSTDCSILLALKPLTHWQHSSCYVHTAGFPAIDSLAVLQLLRTY